MTSHAGHRGASEARLAWTLALIVVYALAEVVGGLVSGSLALLADAGHMVSDAGAITLSLLAFRFARRAPTSSQTYGFHRAEILAALVNGAVLVGIALYVAIEAVERLRDPQPVAAPLMLAVAAGGLLVNVIALWLLHAERHGSLNARGAWLHVLADTLGSVQVIAAALLIWAFGWTWVDPLASLLIAGIVVVSSWELLKGAVAVLMEGAPGHIDVDAVREALLRVDGVTDVHDLHVWSITSGLVALSAHLVVEPAAAGDVLPPATAVLRQGFPVEHVTLQIDVGMPCHQVTHWERE